MGRAIGRTLNQVVEVDQVSPIWLAVELSLDFVDVDLYGLYVSAHTLAADDTDITDRLHFARFVILRNLKLDATDSTSSLQAQIQRESTNKVWEKISYGYFSADISHQWLHAFRLHAGHSYTIAVDFGFDAIGLANSDLFRFSVHGEYLASLKTRSNFNEAKEAKP